MCVPIRDHITTPTAACLASKTDGPVQILTEVGLPVDIARNRLAARVLAMRPRPRFVIWADSDAVWTSKTFDVLREDVSRLGPAALVGVLHGPRAPFNHPHVFIDTKPPIGTPIEWLKDYPKRRGEPGDVKRVTFVGAHMYAHDVRLLERLGPNPWAVTKMVPSEDFAFVMRVHTSGGSVWCSIGTPVLHFDEVTGLGYLPGYFNPFIVNADGSFVQADDSTLAGIKREQQHRSYGAAVDNAMRRNMIAAGVAPTTSGPVTF